MNLLKKVVENKFLERFCITELKTKSSQVSGLLKVLHNIKSESKLGL